MLTQKDLNEIEKIIDGKLDDKFQFYPTKDELFTRLDKIMSEVKTLRESQEIHSNAHSEINDRLGNLEKVFKTS